MKQVSMKVRRKLADKLMHNDILTQQDRDKLLTCLRMLDSLHADLRVAVSDVEGRIRDNNFLLVTSLARRAEIARLRGSEQKCVSKTLSTFAG